MSTNPVTTPVELELPKRESRTVLLCLPCWVPLFWAIVLMILDKIKPAYAHFYLTFKPVLYTASISAIIAPLCWIAAFVGIQRANPATKFQKLAVALSALIMVGSWFALWRFGRS